MKRMMLISETRIAVDGWGHIATGTCPGAHPFKAISEQGEKREGDRESTQQGQLGLITVITHVRHS